MTLRTCKFCGCSERHACSIPVRVFGDAENKFEIWFGPILQLDLDIEYIPCEWLLPDVCTNPDCVAKAYEEAHELEIAIAIQGLVDQGLVEIDGDRVVLTKEGHVEAGRLLRRSA